MDNRSSYRCARNSVGHEVLLSASVAAGTIFFLFLFYDGLFHLHMPSLRQLLIGLIPQMVFVLIWRHYIYNRLVTNHRNKHQSADLHDNERGHMNMLLQYNQHWYATSCLIFVFGNCLLPIQIIFGDNQLQPNTGDPYPFGIVCAICHAFMDVLLGLNLIIDMINFMAGKVAQWTSLISLQVRTMAIKVGRVIRQFRAPLTFLLSAKIVLGGVLIALEDPIVVSISVPIRNLPESLDGFRIIQLSDMHVGVSVGRSRVERVVKVVNEVCNTAKRNNQQCDLVALTGDIVDGEPYQLIKAIEPLSQLLPEIPKVFVTGNHEHIHRNVDHTIELLSEMGIDSLVNRNILLPKGKPRKKQLVVAGLNDFSFRQSSREDLQAFEGTSPKEDTIILLAHQPNHLKVARQHGVDLMLSGHTHAGQFFPGTLGAWLFNSKFSGYYPSEETAVYVSAGTLWWGPPVRFTTRHHEITDIRLKAMKK